MRLPIVYGPNDKNYKVVTRIINKLKAGERPKVETGKKFRFVYVDDIARLIESEVDVMKGNVGKPYFIRDLISGIRQCLKEEK